MAMHVDLCTAPSLIPRLFPTKDLNWESLGTKLYCSLCPTHFLSLASLSRLLCFSPSWDLSCCISA